jgi:hypothetical protein
MPLNSDLIRTGFQEIREMLPRFSRQQLLELDKEIHDYSEITLLTKASETAFSEWEDPEEDIYKRDV